MNHFKTSALGLQVLKHFEGLKLTAYQDSVGVWTIGYGTTTDVHKGQIITEDTATQFLERDLAIFEAAVNGAVTTPISQAQFDALVVFTYNVGAGNFKSSTLLKLVNARDFDNCPAQFLRWNKAGGQVLNGLTKRRTCEANLFATGEVIFE